MKEPINRFDTQPKRVEEFYLPKCNAMEVIDVVDHELMTYESIAKPSEDDILKIAVINRYSNTPIKGIAHVRGFGLRDGAIASSVAHDSHNIIVVGCSDEAMAEAVNLIIEARGGISAVSSTESHLLPLEIAGIMSSADGFEVAIRYEELDRFAKESLGSPLGAPFMTLSFMALLVIPELKLSDKGLFDGRDFHFVSPCRDR
jgi:adenine deaminase